MTMAESVKLSIPKTENARKFKIKECSQLDLGDKSIVGSIMSELTKKNKVNDLGNGSLRVIIGPELKAMLVQKEGRLKKMKDQVVHLVLEMPAAIKENRDSRAKSKRKRSVSLARKRDTLRKIGFSSIQPIRGAEQYLFMEKRMKERIEGFGTYRLILDIGCHIYLEECLYVPSFNVTFKHGGFSLYQNDYFHGSGTLFNIDAKFYESLFNIESQDIKSSASNKSSAFLWHQRLGHISKERMMMLGYVFYNPNHSTRIVETDNASFIQNGQTRGSNVPQKVDIQEIQVEVPLPVIALEVVVPIVSS
ncbi:LOW QUALITY PROTEIN: hypothetical protein V2J09_022461 [Rumex salicifolius]